MTMMTKVLAIASIAAVLCACTVEQSIGGGSAKAEDPAKVALAPNSTLISSGIPPVRFRGDNVAAVFFVDDVTKLCGRAKPGFVILACAQGNQIAMPNPCAYAASERYARIMCHELAHVSGWPATHGD